MKATSLILALTSLTLITSIEAQAQAPSSTASYEVLEDAPSSNAVQLEITAGPGFGSMSLSDPGSFGEKLGSKTGLNFGVGFNIPLSNSISFGTGLNYVQKGFGYSEKFNETITSGGTTTTVTGEGSLSGNINYLVIPAMLNANFGESTRFTIGAGPYAAFKVSSSLSATVTANGQSETKDEEFGKLKSTDFGLRAGAGVAIPMDRSLSFLVGANYDLGLSNVAEDSGNDTAQTRTFIASLGLGIKL